MRDKNDKSMVKTFRMQFDLVEKVDILRKVKNVPMQKIITDAIEEYAASNLGEAMDSINKVNKIQNDYNIEEYILIPIGYYAMFNDLALIEVKAQIKRGKLKSIELGSNTLVLIDINESFYKKAELLAIKNNVSNIAKELYALKAKVNKIERKISNENVEEQGN
jgi:valyl-tRNA synthetase